MPTNNGRNPAATGGSTTNNHRPRRKPLSIQSGRRYKTGGKRDLILVSCPFCKMTHHHFASSPDVHVMIRHPRCRPWRRYGIKVVEVIPYKPASDQFTLGGAA